MDVFQLLLAATKAAHDNETGKLATQTISSEIIYNLSPSKNVCQPFSLPMPTTHMRCALNSTHINLGANLLTFTHFIFELGRLDCRVVEAVRDHRGHNIIDRRQDWRQPWRDHGGDVPDSWRKPRLVLKVGSGKGYDQASAGKNERMEQGKHPSEVFWDKEELGTTRRQGWGDIDPTTSFETSW